jgi:multisubunit Na+/H+ antiporter MnhE subunit
MKGISAGVGVILGGAFVGYIIQQIIPEFVTGTSVSENIYTYIVPFGVFISCIIAAFFLIFKKRGNKPNAVV